MHVLVCCRQPGWNVAELIFTTPRGLDAARDITQERNPTMKLIFEEIREDISAVEYHGKPSQSAAHIKAYFDKGLQVLVVDCTAQVQRPTGTYRPIDCLSRRVITEIKSECWQNNRSAAMRKAIEIADTFYYDMASSEIAANIAMLDAPVEECPF